LAFPCRVKPSSRLRLSHDEEERTTNETQSGNTHDATPRTPQTALFLTATLKYFKLFLEEIRTLSCTGATLRANFARGNQRATSSGHINRVSRN
jgi:hypothetical protein